MEFILKVGQPGVAQVMPVTAPSFSGTSQAQGTWDLLGKASATASAPGLEEDGKVTSPTKSTSSPLDTSPSITSEKALFTPKSPEATSKATNNTTNSPKAIKTANSPDLLDFAKRSLTPSFKINNTVTDMKTPAVVEPAAKRTDIVVLSANAPPNTNAPKAITKATTVTQNTTAGARPSAANKEDAKPQTAPLAASNKVPKAIPNATLTAKDKAATTPAPAVLGYDNPKVRDLWANTPDAPEPIKKALASPKAVISAQDKAASAPIPLARGYDNSKVPDLWANTPDVSEPIKKAPTSPEAVNWPSGGMGTSKWASEPTVTPKVVKEPSRGTMTIKLVPGMDELFAGLNGPDPPTGPRTPANAPTAPRDMERRAEAVAVEAVMDSRVNMCVRMFKSCSASWGK
jgi:hypothetical protein